AQVASLVFLPPGTIRWRRLLTCAILTALLTVPLGVFILTRDSGPLDWVGKPALGDVYSLFGSLTGNGGPFLLLSYFVPCLVSFVFTVQILVRLKKSQLLWRHALVVCWL